MEASSSSTADDATHPRSLYHSLLFIFLTALVLRLAVISIGHTYRITPRRDHFQFGWEMGRLARSLALGQGFSSPTDLPTGASAWAPPVYPYILSAVFRMFGIYSAASAWVILAFNSFFAALTCVTIYKLGERIYGIGVARAAAWTWALFPYAIYWPTRVVWETSLTTFLLSLALLQTLRLGDRQSDRRAWILFGLLWGLILLTNTTMVGILPFCLVWLLHKSPQRRGLLLNMALSMGIAAVAITPWLVRDYATFGQFIFIRDNLPLELHMANNDRSSGLWTRSEHPANDAEAMRNFQQFGELRFMQEKQREFRAFLLQHPGQVAEFSAERALYFWIGTPQLVLIGNWDLLIARHTGFFLYSAVSFAGLWLTLRDRKPGGFLLACLLIFYPLPYYLVNPFPRYKHPMEPAMILLLVYSLSLARKVRLDWPGWHREKLGEPL